MHDAARTATIAFAGRALAAVLLVAIALLAFAPPAAAAEIGGRAGAFIVTDEDGRVLRSRRADTVMHPASLTKMMTIYLAFDALERGALEPDQALVVSRHAASMPPSDLGLRRGDRITVREAIRAAAIKSANDAAVVLAEAIGGDEKRFARLMTRKARALGMKDTTFLNASGLTKRGHLSTARDMATLARRLATDFADYYWIFAEPSVRIGRRSWRATNRLLGVVPGLDGIKTGYTARAGFNLAASAIRDDRRVYVVLLGGRSRVKRDAAVAALIEDGFERLGPRRERDREPDATPWAVAAAPRPTPRPGRETLAVADATARVPASAGGGAAASRARADAAERISRRAREAAPLAVPSQEAWAIQVGAFADKASARAELQRISTSGAPGLEAAFRSVERADAGARVVHRARFSGLGETDARAACRALTRRGERCALVPPSGWRVASAD